MKPVFGHLRSLGYLSVIYINDTYLQGQTYEECCNNVQSTSNLISELGFCINEDESEFRPSKQLVFLGFVLDSVTMRVYLTEAKQEKIVSKIQSVLKNVRKGITIREFAKLIGLLVSSCIAIPFSMVYTEILEHEKSIALKHAKGRLYEAKMEVSQAAISDLQWWMASAKNNKGSPVHISPPQITVITDSSLIGWGAVCNDIKTGGQWGLSEIPNDNNIDYLELKAVYLGLLSFREELSNKHVRVETDNSATVAYVNHMGGGGGETRSDSCNSIARKFWELPKQCNMWLTAVHIPGRDNVITDRESRIFHDNT